jgi:hypothetical protein
MTDGPMTVEAALADGSAEAAGKALEAMAAQFRGPAPSATPTDSAGAKARLDALVADPAVARKFFAGDQSTVAEFKALHEKIANGNSTVDALNAKPDAEPDSVTMEVTVGNQLNSRNRAAAVAGLREGVGFDDATIAQAIDGAAVSEHEVAMAKMTKAMRLSDPAYVARYLAGSFSEKRELAHLDLILSGAAA